MASTVGLVTVPPDIILINPVCLSTIANVPITAEAVCASVLAAAPMPKYKGLVVKLAFDPPVKNDRPVNLNESSFSVLPLFRDALETVWIP